MKPSRYLNSFKALESKDFHQLIGDTLLVERIPLEEKKTASGIIMATAAAPKQVGSINADLPIFVHVIAVGKGHYDPETGEDVPLSIEPGDIILVGGNSVKWFSMMDIDGYQPYDIGLSRESEMQLRFKGIEAYNEYFSIINQTLEPLAK